MSINPKRCYHCGKGIMSYLHFFGGQAGYHRFVPEHKHVYKLVPEPKGVFRLQLKIHYLFECRVCKDFQVVQRHVFWHGTPWLDMRPPRNNQYFYGVEFIRDQAEAVEPKDILLPDPDLDD